MSFDRRFSISGFLLAAKGGKQEKHDPSSVATGLSLLYCMDETRWTEDKNKEAIFCMRTSASV